MKTILKKIGAIFSKDKPLPYKYGLWLGIVHFIIVGLPFITSRGTGDGLMYIVFVDLPLLPLLFLPIPLQDPSNATTFVVQFIVYVVMGTMMYAGAGWIIGKIIIKFKKVFIRHSGKSA